MKDFFGSSTTPKYYGFIAQSNASPTSFVVAFRGTETMEEWWDDLHWGLVPFTSLPNGGYVASGFLDIFNTRTGMFPGSNAAAAPLPALKTLAGAGVRDSGLSLVTVGHSLGAALTTLYAGYMAGQENINPKVYTLASPRVGDKTFATAYNSAIAVNYRIYNWPDLVPDFPKDPFDHYQHVKGGYEVDSLDYPTKIKISVECFHSSLTCLFLLRAPQSILGGCGL